jgi:DNA replication protein DnaC
MSITSKHINRLVELEWIDRMFNLIFLGPPGVGKTHLNIAMGLKAVEAGYKVSFVSMDNLMHVLKTQDISRKSKGKVNSILSSSIIIIDELGYLPITKEEANMFF